MKEHLRQNDKRYILGIFFLVNFFIWYALVAETTRAELAVSFLNAGQGDSILIEAPGGNQILIDGGSGKQVLRELGKVLPFYDHSINIILTTHPDKDHIGGLPEVLNRFKVDYFVEPGTESDTGAYKELEKIIDKKNIPKFIARRGMVIDLGRGVLLSVLSPYSDVTHLKQTNDASIIIKLTYGDTSVMLTGDAPEKIESRLVSLDGKNLKSDVLKVGHHGSRTSSGAAFLGYVNPGYAVISVGAKNSYGHPTQEVIDRLQKLKIKILRTDQDGTIVFKSNGEEFKYYLK